MAKLTIIGTVSPQDGNDDNDIRASYRFIVKASVIRLALSD
jgi:hypothetical protein